MVAPVTSNPDTSVWRPKPLSVPVQLNCGHLLNYPCLMNYLVTSLKDTCPFDGKKIENITFKNTLPSKMITFTFFNNKVCKTFYATLDTTINTILKVVHLLYADTTDPKFRNAIIEPKGIEIIDNLSETNLGYFVKSEISLKEIRLTPDRSYRLNLAS